MIKRKIFLASWLAFIAAGLGWMFWQQEIKYLMPTPVPEGYQPIPLNTMPALPAGVGISQSKPVFLHFFNPECPCSRFNVAHFNQLVRQYGTNVSFKVIIPSYADPEAAKDIIEEDVPIIFDKNDQISEACGVYASPQAVLLEGSGKLYYRGNYNKARYCTQKDSNYAEQAIINLLEGKPPIDFGLFSSQAYGCELGNPLGFSFLSL